MTIALLTLLTLYALWVFYLANMALKRARREGTLTQQARIISAPIVGLGALLGIAVNVVILTVLFVELPRELFATYRLRRYVNGPMGLRRTMAEWIALHITDAFDPAGAHIMGSYQEPL